MCPDNCLACQYLDYLDEMGWFEAFAKGDDSFLDIPVLTFEEWKNTTER